MSMTGSTTHEHAERQSIKGFCGDLGLHSPSLSAISMHYYGYLGAYKLPIACPFINLELLVFI